MKKLYLSIFFILFFFKSFSQENYVPGHIIKINNDTIFGSIDYRNWEKNPKVVHFKSNNGDPISFKPIDIIEFSVQDEIYVSAIVDVEISSTKTNRLSDHPELRIKTDTTFLQSLFRGEKELYYYLNEEGRESFYIKRDSVFDLLIYKKYIKKQSDRDAIVENKNFVGQLKLYLNNCSFIQPKLNTSKYTLKSLYDLFEFYNECFQYPYNIQNKSIYSYKKKFEKTRTKLGILVGGALTSLKFQGMGHQHLILGDFNKSIDFTTGIYLELILPRNQGKWSITNELLYTSYFVKGKYVDFRNEDYYITTTTELGYSYLNLNSLVRYKYPIGKSLIFFNGGISIGFTVNETNYKKKESIIYTIDRISEEAALNETRKIELAYIFGSGVKFKKFSFEVRVERGNGMTKYLALKTSTYSLYCLLGYDF